MDEVTIDWAAPSGPQETRWRPGWRDRRRLRAVARALACAPCNGREGPCTCGTACACTCPREWHDHLRAGTDCWRCGKAACPRYRPPGRITRRLALWRPAEISREPRQ